LTFTGYARTDQDRLFLIIALGGRQGIRAIEFERFLEGRTQISPEFRPGFALGIYAGDFCHPANPPSRVLFNDCRKGAFLDRAVIHAKNLNQAAERLKRAERDAKTHSLPKPGAAV